MKLNTFNVNVIESEVLSLPLPTDHVDDQIRVLHGFSQRLLVLEMERRVEHLTKITAHLQRVDIVVVTAVGDNHLSANFTKFVTDIFAQKSTGTKNGGYDSIEAATSSGSPPNWSQSASAVG